MQFAIDNSKKKKDYIKFHRMKRGGSDIKGTNYSSRGPELESKQPYREIHKEDTMSLFLFLSSLAFFLP